MAVQLKGIDELNKGLSDRMKLEAVKQIVKQNGAEMQQKAQRNTPVRTGDLKRSELLDIVDNGMTAKVTAGMDYSPYVEYGTRYMTGRRYMGRAFEEQKRIFVRDLEKLAR